MTSGVEGDECLKPVQIDHRLGEAATGVQPHTAPESNQTLVR